MNGSFHGRSIGHGITGYTHIYNLVGPVTLQHRNQHQRRSIVNQAPVLPVAGYTNHTVVHCLATCSRLPIGSCPCQYRSANALLIIETGGAPSALSMSVKSRPSSKAVRTVRRYSGPAAPRSISMDSFFPGT